MIVYNIGRKELPMIKICTICKLPKETGEFNKNKTRKDGLNTLCKECSQARSKQYYSENKEKHSKVCHARNKRYLTALYTWINTLKSTGCILCDESDPCCIDFHHLNPEIKENNIATLIRNLNLKQLANEIRKCVLVCANCHRKVHSKNIKLYKKDLCKVEDIKLSGLLTHDVVVA